MKKKIFLGFSMMELIISAIVLAVITSATAPIVVKKLQSDYKKNISNSIMTEGGTSSSACLISFKRNGRKICLMCKRTCARTQFQVKETCECINCSNHGPYGAACNSCTSMHCRQCDAGYGLYIGLNNPQNDNERGSCTSVPAHPTHPSCTVKPANTNYYTPSVVWNAPNSTTPWPCFGYCPKGYFSIGTMSCQICTPGHYQALPGQSQCNTLCSAGYKCPGYGNWEMTACVYNVYQDQTGQAECKGCPANSRTRDANAHSRINQCVCNGGYWRTAVGTNTCPECGIGYYCPDSNGENTDVGEGPDKRRHQCPPGSTTTTKTATSITQCICSANSYKVGYNAATGAFARCEVCPDGYWCDGTNAHPCGAGVYCPGTGNTGTRPCPAGYYCPAPGPNGSGISKCSCGTYSTGGAANCTANTTPGTYTPCAGALCTGVAQCPQGHFSTNGGCACTPCPKGQYQTFPGRSFCNKCDDYKKNSTTNQTGSTSRSQCICGAGTSSYSSRFNLDIRYQGACCKHVTSATKAAKCTDKNGAYFRINDCLGLCIKKSNATGNNVSGVKRYAATSNASSSTHYCKDHACCWYGTTAKDGHGMAKNDTGRPVCNWKAAKKVCPSGWRLLTNEEIWDYLTTGNSDKLDLCWENFKERNKPNLTACTLDARCPGGRTNVNNGQWGMCATHMYWGVAYEDLLSSNDGLLMGIIKDSQVIWGENRYKEDANHMFIYNLDTDARQREDPQFGHVPLYPASVRCAKDITED